MTTDPEVAEVADVAAAPGDARGATTRLLMRGAWSFVVSGLLSMASSFVDESVARYLDTASLLAWIPGVRALLFLGESLESRALSRSALGLFWSTVLVQVMDQGLEAMDHDGQVWITVLGWLAFVGVLFYVLRPHAGGESLENRTKIFAGVGVGLLLLGKLLVKLKFWHLFGLGRLTRGMTGFDLETFELLLMRALLLLAAGCTVAMGIALLRRRSVHGMFGLAGVFTLVSFAISAAIAVFGGDEGPAPVLEALSVLAGFAWSVLMAAMLLAFGRQGAPTEHAPLVG